MTDLTTQDFGLYHSPSRLYYIGGLITLGWLWTAMSVMDMALRGVAGDAGPGMGIFAQISPKSLSDSFGLPYRFSLCITETGDWTFKDFVQAFMMWIAMVLAMMLPTLLLSNRQNPISSAFTLGYLWIWAIASLFAVALQWGLSAGAQLNSHMLSQSSILNSLILIGVGSYQLSPIKHRLVLACLHKDDQTRAPIGKGSDIAQNIRSDMKLGMTSGMDAGVNCVKCCGPLMLIMFVFGLMNAVIMALMTLFILSERHVKYSYGLIKASGIGLIFMGLGIGLQNWL